MYKGLTTKEVEERINNNQYNINSIPLTKSVKEIILSNTLTLFNFINIFLGFLVFLTSSYKNLLFLGIILFNTLLSTINEIRSKKITDKLALLSKSKVKVIREEKEVLINQEEIVKDDLMILRPGDQVICDAVIIDGTCQINESFITGEMDNIPKKKGDMLLSGSFVIENKVIVRVINVGKDNYVSKITSEAKYIKEVNSIILKTLNKIIKYISIIIIPIGLLLFFNQYSIDKNFNYSILNTVAALIGMIPDGLILLTSSVLALSTIKLSARNVLVQQLFCVETLARVDTICLDKTGTLTNGYMEVSEIIPISKDIDYVKDVITKLATVLDNDSSSIDAIKRKFSSNIKYNVKEIIPFSSIHKFSAITDDMTYILGAPLLLTKDEKVIEKINELSKKGRVLGVAISSSIIRNKKIPDDTKIIGLILLKDEIKESASNIINYLKKQDINIKIISGDDINTINMIANEVGINTNSIDLSNIENSDIKNYIDKNIFARVTPHQKRIIIEELQKKGCVVAMIGDGVNDCLALKKSDCSITFGNATSVARNVSELVLLDNSMDSIPYIIKEGRNSINNIERSSSLFLTKTLYAIILGIIFVFVNLSYPFIPIQLSLYNFITIGIPSFILAFEPNNKKVDDKNFLYKVLRNAVPTSIAVVFAIITSSIIGSVINFNIYELSTLCTYVLVIIGFRNLYKVCYPFNGLRTILYISLIILFIFMTIFLKNLYSLVSIDMLMLSFIFMISFISIIIFNLVEKVYDYFYNKHINKKEKNMI